MAKVDLKPHARTLARRVVGSLPPSARGAIAAARQALANRPVAETPPSLPDDVADLEALRNYLRDTDIFGPAKAEADGYLTDALERFRLTMALLPDLEPGGRVLELGANPYFLTRLLLRRGYEMTLANYFGDGYAGPNAQVVVAADHDEKHVFEFDHFNIEREAFPYPDGSFDLVLCCEILEHLPSDPIHMLAEIHRVLAQPSGMLLLTTPNAARATNVRRILDGQNPYEELSGYGTYGRHNREYTVDELRTLLEELGYEVVHVFAADIHAHPKDLLRWVPMVPEHRGDNLFAIARPRGEPRWRYPRWLYSSQHALQRVVRPDLLAGHNDELQARGLHAAEQVGGRWFCWTGGVVTATLVAPLVGPVSLRVEGLAPPAQSGESLDLIVEINGTELVWTLECGGEPFDLRAPIDVEPGELVLEMRTSRVWIPRDIGMSDDSRTLGVMVHRISVERTSAD